MLDTLQNKGGGRYIEVINISAKRLETIYQVVVFEFRKCITTKALKSISPIQTDLMLMKKELPLNYFSVGIQTHWFISSGIWSSSRCFRRRTREILENIKQAL